MTKSSNTSVHTQDKHLGGMEGVNKLSLGKLEQTQYYMVLGVQHTS